MNYCVTTSPRSRKAFTIIELLAAIAIIGILAAIAFGVSQGVNERSRKSRVQSDLMLLTQHLEQYKTEYGDFPRVEFSDSDSPAAGNKVEGEQGNYRLYHALNGMRPVRGETLTGIGFDATGGYSDPDDRQKSFIDRSKFTFEFSPSLSPPTSVLDPEVAAVTILDPWGNAYRYFYDPELSTWKNKTYVLYSVGPDGLHDEPDKDGYPDFDHDDNLDNIYANRNNF